MALVGIVGHEAAKFSALGEMRARAIIRGLLKPEGAVLVSGGCHLGGIDIWAEEEYRKLGKTGAIIHKPKSLDWANGYKPRNLLIAKDSNVVHCIVVSSYHPGYKGMKFNWCYHCGTNKHIKSGGCWTAKRADVAVWHVVEN